MFQINGQDVAVKTPFGRQDITAMSDLSGGSVCECVQIY